MTIENFVKSSNLEKSSKTFAFKEIWTGKTSALRSIPYGFQNESKFSRAYPYGVWLCAQELSMIILEKGTISVEVYKNASAFDFALDQLETFCNAWRKIA